MEAKKYLSRAMYLKHVIEARMFQIDMLQTLARNMMSRMGSSGPSGKSRNVDAMPDTVDKIMAVVEELEKSAEDFLEERKKIDELIKKVPEDYPRLILEERYMCGLCCEDIARKMNFSLRWVQLRCNEGLNKVQEFLDDMGE